MDHGFDIDTRTAEYDKNTVTLCSVDDASDCTQVTDPTLKAGRPAEFTINRADISPRLVVGSGTKVHSKGHVDFERLSAYQSMSDDSLGAIIRISSNRRDRRKLWCEVPHPRRPTGGVPRQLPAELAWAPTPTSWALVIVPRATVGGVIALQWATRDTGPLVVAEATIPTRRN